VSQKKRSLVTFSNKSANNNSQYIFGTKIRRLILILLTLASLRDVQKRRTKQLMFPTVARTEAGIT